MSDSEAARELGEISDRLKELLNALQGFKSYRDGALIIKQTRRQIRSLSKRRGAILVKINRR